VSSPVALPFKAMEAAGRGGPGDTGAAKPVAPDRQSSTLEASTDSGTLALA
jgi:hypothetical protein